MLCSLSYLSRLPCGIVCNWVDMKEGRKEERQRRIKKKEEKKEEKDKERRKIKERSKEKELHTTDPGLILGTSYCSLSAAKSDT